MIDKQRALEALSYLNGIVTTMRAGLGMEPRVLQEDDRIQSHIDALREFITEANDKPCEVCGAEGKVPGCVRCETVGDFHTVHA